MEGSWMDGRTDRITHIIWMDEGHFYSPPPPMSDDKYGKLSLPPSLPFFFFFVSHFIET